MVLVLVVGDLHFKKDTPTLTDLVIHKISDEVAKIKPDIVVFLGDILDTHEKIDLKTLNRSIKFIKHIAAMNIQVFVIIGNHERPDGTSFLTEDSSFYCLKGMANIHVADRVLDLKWEIEGHKDKVRFIFAPYVPAGKFHEALDTLEEKVMSENRPAAIFCHQEFKGCQIGGYKSKGGDDWPETNPIVISGHIHTFQVLQNNIIYAGTPYQQSWSDESQKGIILAEFVPGKAPQINMLNLDIRKKKSIKLKPSEVASYVPPANTDLQIEIVGNIDEIKALDATGVITKMRSKGVSVSTTSHREVNPSNPENKPYKELLMDMIKTDTDATQMFHEIFAPQAHPNAATASVPINLTELLKAMQSIGAQPMTAEGKPFDLQGMMAAMTQQQQVAKQTEKAPVAPSVLPQQAPLFPTPAQLPGTVVFGNLFQPQKEPETPATMRLPGFASEGSIVHTATPVVVSPPEPKLSNAEVTASLISCAQTEKTAPKAVDFMSTLIAGLNAQQPTPVTK